MKEIAKSILFKVCPGVATSIQRVTTRRHLQRLDRELGLDRVVKLYVEHRGMTVRDGPFAGMRYVKRAAGSTLLPKLIGSYELELHGWINEIIEHRYSLICDIGSAEGYYAIGLALRIPQSRVLAIDTDSKARELCRQNASLNGIADRIAVYEGRGAQGIATLLEPGALVICDCEGAEEELLDPMIAPVLRNCDMVVELHDEQRPGIKQRLIDRFDKTHSVSVVSSSERDPSQFPDLDFLSPDEQQLALSEMRHGPQQWIMLQANSGLCRSQGS